jgi:fructan beta-fructosidase
MGTVLTGLYKAVQSEIAGRGNVSENSVVMSRILWVGGYCAALLLAPFHASAQELLYEGFDYPGGILAERAGGHGWSGGWVSAGGDAADVKDANLQLGTNGMPGFDALARGGSAWQANNGRTGRRIDTSLSGSFGRLGYLNDSGLLGADGKTLYVSFIQEPDGTGLFYEFEFHRGDLGDPGRIAGIGNDLASTTVNFRLTDGTQLPIGSGSTDPALYVIRIDYRAGNDDVCIYRNPRFAEETNNEPVLTLISAGDFSFDGFSFGAYLNDRSVRHDEIRCGATWSDAIGGLPAIQSGPQDLASVVTDPLHLTVQATGRSILTYQWEHNGKPIPGATGTNLSIDAAQLSDAGEYRVVVTNEVGVAVSRTATVRLDPVRITPAAPRLILESNQPMVLAASVAGDRAVTLQWFKNGEPLAGATNESLPIASAQIADAGEYFLVARHANGALTSAVSRVFATRQVLLAYEGFEYMAGSGNLPGQNGGFGWSEPWVKVGGAAASVLETNLSASSQAPAGFDERSVNGAVLQPAQSRSGRYLDCSPNGPFAVRGFINPNGLIGADGQSLYLSFIQQPNGTGKFYEFELHRGDLGDPGRIAGIGNDLGASTVNFRAGSGTQIPIGPGTTSTSLFVLRIDFKPGPDTVRIYRNPAGTQETNNTPALTVTNAGDMSFNGISMAAFENGRTVAHDEIRLGAAWEDVVGLPTAALQLAGAPPAGRVHVGGSPGYEYRLQNASDVDGPWRDQATNTMSRSGANVHAATNELGTNGYYRTVLDAQLHRKDLKASIADFEKSGYGDWVATGTAFGAGPAQGALPNQQAISGYAGSRLVNSFLGGDPATGTLTSPLFTITGSYIQFLVGGGNHPDQTAIRLRVGGQVVRSTTGANDEMLKPAQWDVTEFKGSTGVIEIVDLATGSWGHINIDQISQTDIPLPRYIRELVATRNYLNLPIRNGAPMRRMSVTIDGRIVREFDIQLAERNPDWWAFLDLQPFNGKKVILEADHLPSDSQALSSIYQDDEIADAESLYQEPLRPQVHFSTRRGWINDANGPIYYAGEYHLFYQHNPYGWDWGNMHWGHAVSADLVHWRELPIGLYPHTYGDMAYSGSAVIDWNNTAGFKTSTNDVMVVAYTSTGRGECIAFSNDRGRTFTDYPGNPVVKNVGRDPRIFWYAPSNHWSMVVYNEDPGLPRGFAFYSSTNLREWTCRSRISDFFECPDLFPLPVDGKMDQIKWVLNDASGDYLVGRFDGGTFTAETGKLKGNGGNAFYASQTFTEMPEGDGRRVQISWGRVPTPGMPFNQMMLFPTELSLRTFPEGIRLCAVPVRELESLRQNEYSWTGLSLAAGKNPLMGIRGDLMELNAEFEPGTAEQVMFTFRGVAVSYTVATQRISCDGMSNLLPLTNGKIKLRILADRTSIEIFGNDGQLYMPMRANYSVGDKTHAISVQGGQVSFESLKVHTLKSAWRTVAD